MNQQVFFAEQEWLDHISKEPVTIHKDATSSVAIVPRNGSEWFVREIRQINHIPQNMELLVDPEYDQRDSKCYPCWNEAKDAFENGSLEWEFPFETIDNDD